MANADSNSAADNAATDRRNTFPCLQVFLNLMGGIVQQISILMLRTTDKCLEVRRHD
jgi:hypothetical protein